MTLEDLKSAASEIKALRPIQEAIVQFFKVNTWEEVEAEFGKEVSPEKLMWFAVSTRIHMFLHRNYKEQ